jgi:2-polyprenyl-3-methyl-5-hydroxy-6-metoxy-1,4-benzoquinol methylase
MQSTEYYRKEYRKEHSNRAEASQANTYEIFDVYYLYQRSRLDIIRPFLSKNKSLIDIGCSAGQFIEHIRSEVASVNGIELDRDCCIYVNEELGISCDDNYLPQSKFKNDKYNVVCSFQVMEHVPDPVFFLLELLEVSKPGGKIYI